MGRTLHHGPLTADQSALAASWFPLTKKVARQWQRRYPQIWADLLQSATHMGLVKAARAYEPAQELPFAALLCTCMRQELRDVVKAWFARKKYQELFWTYRSWSQPGWILYREADPYSADPRWSHELITLVKDILSLHYDHGLSQRDIALLLGCNRHRLGELFRSPLAADARQEMGTRP